MGELHLDVIIRRIKDEFGVELLVGKPQVVYKESVEKAVSKEHTFEKLINNVQCKGWVSLEIGPNGRGQGIMVTSRIGEANPVYPFAGVIEEGIVEASNMGVLRGYPLTDIRVDVNDATFNNPEFARLTLKMAAYDAFREACNDAGPILLVPIMSLTVTTPNEFMGDIISDLNSRKCQITNVAAKDRITIILAHAPLTKMFGYSTDVRSLSQGRASFTMYFSHYDKIDNG
jgi:elongation factor G